MITFEREKKIQQIIVNVSNYRKKKLYPTINVKVLYFAICKFNNIEFQPDTFITETNTKLFQFDCTEIMKLNYFLLT